MGFTQYDDPDRPHDIMVRRVLHRSFVLPVDAKQADIEIGFYPERRLYAQMEVIPPVLEYRVVGAHLDDGSIMLDRRVVALASEEPDGKDLVIKVEVDGNEWFLGKAKYAGDVGVVHDSRGGAFYTDVLKLRSSEGDTLRPGGHAR
jgi:hypothetical protein